jgi:Fe-S cluster assembly protein SufD
MGTPCPEIATSLKNLLEHRKEKNLRVSPWQEQALSALEISGLPSTDNENWKYTSSTQFLNSFKTAGLIKDKAHFELDLKDLKSPRLLFINGKLHVEASRLNDSFELKLKEPSSFHEDAEFIPFFHAYDEINLIGLEEEIELRLKNNSGNNLNEELYLYYYYFSDRYNNFHPSKLNLHLDAGAHLVIREEHLHKDDMILAHVSNIQDVFIEEKAKLEQIVLEASALMNQSFVYSKRKVTVEKEGQFDLNFFHLAQKFKREEILVMLKASEAKCDISGLGLGQNKGHIDHFIRVHHLAPQTFSKQLIKNIVKDQSRSVFTGMVFIDKNCSLCESEQLNKNLLMDRLAHVDTRPQLEVLNHDVKCSHGATIGRFSEDELFYLTSRGIEPSYATELLGKAFAGEMLQNLKYPSDLVKLQKTWEQYA